MNIPDSIHCNDLHCTDPTHKEDRDALVLDLLTSTIEASFETIPLTNGRRDNIIHKGRKHIPGWQEQVEPFRQDSLFWHSVWISSGKPRSGQLYNVMCWSRNKYHYAIRKLRKILNFNKAQDLLDASNRGDIHLIAAMKEIKGTKAKGQIMPTCIEGETDPDNILNKFKEVYQALYNTAETRNAMNDIKVKLRAFIGSDSLKEVFKITGSVVMEASRKMKAGKSDVSGGYSSDVFLHGPSSLYETIAAIFRSFLIHGDVTDQLLCCAFLPLFKGGLKNPSKTDSYRAIAGSSQLLKLFDNVILHLWGHMLASDSLQFGYKVGTSTTQCSWLVTEVTDYYLKRGTPIVCVTLDCSKAFDMCKFSTLFQKLIDRKMPSIVIRMLICVYVEQRGFTVWNGVKSTYFDISNRTRQGSVLSPTLFSVYIDDLLKELRRAGNGCHIGGIWVGAAGYADDLVLIAPSRSAMQSMLNICELYAQCHNLQYSTNPVPALSKSKCIFMCGSTDKVYPKALTLFGMPLPWVEHGTHPGHEFHQS